MNLYSKLFVVFITICLLSGCREKPVALWSISGQRIPITDSLPAIDSLEEFILPYRNRVNQVLDSTLAYAPYAITKSDGQWNTTAGNLMADIVLEQAGPIFKMRTGKDLDLVLLNHGGIRSIISQGPVTARTAYEVMPFENQIAVTEMKGPAVRQLISFLIRSGRPHPVAGMQITLDKNKTLQSVTIQGRPFNENRSYFVGTSDYLVKGGDDMGFFRENDTVITLDYKIRNAMIDYFKKVDTLMPVIDNRFRQLK
ncbi:5'-nucleotidase C-terminal domain-containing protein [Lentiprolixibacter aurantiacus]|uniref:5'-nucleotidase n=1 Tax=Lentiprolixibacter aurantiacus TaxID=2993939 RepID=A0AAE3MKF7_9FLAO|nr:5'-nucleotidase [Lentiprolixibacter aurantiacus]MCX2719375.1 5'-nucleotidase [Lentiprolixibacter aurantiacus]